MTNLVIICGRVVRAPETRDMGQQKMTAFSLAQDRHYTKDGEDRTFTSYFDCEAWGDVRVPPLEESQLITVVGRLREDRWRKEGGGWRTRMKVIVSQVFSRPSKSATYDLQFA